MTLILPLVSFFIFLTFGLTIFRKRQIIVLLMVAMFSVSYISLLSVVEYYGNKYTNELTIFDVNGDGVYSDYEQTEGFEEAMDAVTHDTGRTLAPFIGLILCFILSLILGGILKIQSVIIKKREGKYAST